MPSIGEQRINKSHPLEQDLENMDFSSQIKCRGMKPLPLIFYLRKILSLLIYQGRFQSFVGLYVRNTINSYIFELLISNSFLLSGSESSFLGALLLEKCGEPSAYINCPSITDRHNFFGQRCGRGSK